VLCPRCKLPETSMEIGKKKEIIFDCKACGYHGQADMTSKLATFILNNPPDSKGGIQDKASTGKKTKEDRKAEKAKKRADKGKDDDDEEEEDEVVEASSWDKRGGGGGGGAKPPAASDDDDDDDGDWAVDVSDAAVKAREDQAQASFDKIDAAMSEAKVEDKEDKKKKKKDKKSEMVMDDDFGESPMLMQMEKIRTAMQPALEKSEAGATDEAVKMLGAVAKENDLKPNDLFGFIFETFDANAVKQIGAHAKLLSKLYKAAPDAKKTQSFLLTCISTLVCGEQRESLMKKTPVIMKKLYDLDLLEEEAIVSWYDKSSKKKDGKAVREAAAPFVTWLKEADSDEESDDE
jgi:translation initiation factor 5